MKAGIRPYIKKREKRGCETEEETTFKPVM